MRRPFSKGGPVEACSAVTELLPLALSTALEKAQAQGGEIHTGQVIHKSQYLRQKPHIVLPLGALQVPKSLHPRKLKDTAVDQVFTGFPGPNAVYQPEITFIVLPYNIVDTTFT